MQLYAILRRNGWSSPDELKEAAGRSGRVGDDMPESVRWIRSYVLEENAGSLGTVCIYEATSPPRFASTPASQAFRSTRSSRSPTRSSSGLIPLPPPPDCSQPVLLRPHEWRRSARRTFVIERLGASPATRQEEESMNMLTDLTPAQQTARDIWTSGNYAEVADRLIRDFGPVLVQELDIQRGLKVLDVACGAGNVAIPAALAGAEVTGLDITPVLLERGEMLAAASGVDVTWVDGDAEAMPSQTRASTS